MESSSRVEERVETVGVIARSCAAAQRTRAANEARGRGRGCNRASGSTAGPIHSWAARSTPARFSGNPKLSGSGPIRKFVGYGVTSQPAARKQATDRGMCIAEVTSSHRCDASTATTSSVARGLSQVFRDLVSNTIRWGSMPAPSRSLRATADWLSGTVSPLCTSRASGKRLASIRNVVRRSAAVFSSG